jgi:hypothetical protein
VFIFNNYKSSKVIQFILLLYYVRCYAQDYSTALLHGINQPAIQLTKILNKPSKNLDCHLKIDKKTCLYATKRDTPPCVNNTGIDPAWSVRGLLCQLWCRVVSVMCAARPSTYCIWIVHSLLIIMLLLKLLYLILSLLFFALSWKKHPLHPSCQGLEGAPPPPACKSETCNAISDKRRCDLKISHREIVSMDHSLFFFIPFSSIKNMLYYKESVSTTECWTCSIMSLFYLAVYGMLDQCCHWQWLLVHVL